MNFKKSLLVGDLNLRIENKSDKDTIHFYNLMDRYGLAQNVKHPTHFKGGTLDVVLTLKGEEVNINLLSNTEYKDHFPIIFTLPFAEKQKFKPIEKTEVRSKYFDLNLLKKKITSSSINELVLGQTDVDDMVRIYNRELISIYDDICPTRKIRKTSQPWYDYQLKCMKKGLRERERLYKSCNDSEFSLFHQEYKKTS